VRDYRQYCALARALDIVGERWTLLVVRELLDGPHRYAELLAGLPGIATNLLADRLRSLQDSGVVERHRDGRYALTPWGAGLQDAIYALGLWAAPQMLRPLEDDEFRSHWVGHMVMARLGAAGKRPGDVTVEIRCGDEPATLFTTAGRVHLVRGPATPPDVVLDGPPHRIIALILGLIDAASAQARGVSIAGDPRKLARLRPRSPSRGAKDTNTTQAPRAGQQAASDA